MLQIIIDGKMAALPTDFKLGLTLNNFILVERKEDATYPLTLSLKANRHIFGFPERLNNNNFPLELSASVMFGPYTLLSGRTIITDISDTEIELFIATDTTSFYGVNSDKFIDELDMGMERYANPSVLQGILDTSLEAYLPFVATQLYDYDYNQSYYIPKFYNKWDFVRQKLFRKWGVHDNSFCPFLRLVEAIERVVKACGYSVRINDLRKISGFQDIIIIKRVNIGPGATSISYNNHVPHLTVKEFFDEIERKFSVRLFVNEAAKEVHIRSAAVMRSKTVIPIEVLDGVKKTFEDITEKDSDPKGYTFSDKEVDDPNWQRYKTYLSITVGDAENAEAVECRSTIVADRQQSEDIDPVGHEVEGSYETNVWVNYELLEISSPAANKSEFRLAVYRGILNRGQQGPDKEFYGNVPVATAEPLEDSLSKLSLFWTGEDGLYKQFHKERVEKMNFNQTHELAVVPDISVLANIQALLSDNIVARNQRYIVEEEEIELTNTGISEHKLTAHPL